MSCGKLIVERLHNCSTKIFFAPQMSVEMSKHRYSGKVIIRSDAVKKDGTAAVCLQVFLNSKKKVLPLGFSVMPEEFNVDSQLVRLKKPRNIPTQVRKKMTETENDYNVTILKKSALMKHIFAKAIMMDVILTREKFVEEFNNEAMQKDFVHFVSVEIENEKKERTAGTIAQYNQFYNHLTKYRKVIMFSELTFETIDGFQKYLKGKRLSTNTIAKHHKQMKKFVLLAIKKGLPIPNPYANFKIKKKRTTPPFLNEEELERLIEKYQAGSLSPRLQSICRAFLFMCFTGLRDSDVRRLTMKNVGTNEIFFTPQKTQDSLQILKVPLSGPAKKLLPYDRNMGEVLFDLPSTQKFNDALNLIGQYCDFPKLTTKMARHTFATMFLTVGGEVTVLQELMGHANIQTTMNYVHVLPKRKHEGIALFNRLMK